MHSDRENRNTDNIQRGLNFLKENKAYTGSDLEENSAAVIQSSPYAENVACGLVELGKHGLLTETNRTAVTKAGKYAKNVAGGILVLHGKIARHPQSARSCIANQQTLDTLVLAGPNALEAAHELNESALTSRITFVCLFMLSCHYGLSSLCKGTLIPSISLEEIGAHTILAPFTLILATIMMLRKQEPIEKSSRISWMSSVKEEAPARIYLESEADKNTDPLMCRDILNVCASFFKPAEEQKKEDNNKEQKPSLTP